MVPAEDIPARPCPLHPLPQGFRNGSGFSTFLSVLTLKENDQHGFVDSQAKWTRRASKVICFDFLRLSLCLHTSSDGELTNNQESTFIQIALKVILLLDVDLGSKSYFCHFLCSLRQVT